MTLCQCGLPPGEVADVELIYDRLSTDDLRGTTQADYLIALDAHLHVLDGCASIFDEPYFPVVELARGLKIWLESPGQGAFELDSMSFEQRGAIAIWKVPEGWVLGSVLEAGVITAPADRVDLEGGCRRFVARVEGDLAELGLDPLVVLRR